MLTGKWVLACAMAAGLLGAGAHAASGMTDSSITISWDANKEPDLSGYLVWWGTSRCRFTNSVDVGRRTKFHFTEPDTRKTYYFAIQAYDTAGLSSRFSKQIWLEAHFDKHGREKHEHRRESDCHDHGHPQHRKR